MPPPPRCKEGDMATASILHSIVWLSSPSFSLPPPLQCCKDFVGVAEEGEKSVALLRLLLLIDIDGAAAHVAETHLGIDNETSDLCTDGADMDSGQSEQTDGRGGIIINGLLPS